MSRSRHTPASRGGSWIWPATRWAIYHRDDFACIYCRRVGSLSIDHIESVKSIGREERDDAPKNLVTACITCNSVKQAMTVRKWFSHLRALGFDVPAIRRRIARARATPIDRERGRLLARMDEHVLEGSDWSIPGLDLGPR